MTDELLIRFLLNETNEEEGVAVQQWLAADRGNRKQFEQFEQIWKASKDLAVSSSRDEDRAWAKFQRNAAASAMANASTEAALTISDDKTGTAKTGPLQEAVIRPLKLGFGWIKIAAMLLLIGGVWAAYTLFGPERYKDLTAYNKVLVAQLPDGSELTLNKNAEISYLRNFKRHRSVKLHKGEVFFSVAHDKSRPFVIEIGKVSVTVVGTSFNIKKLNTQTEVIVETGIVRVELKGEKIELHKGEKILIQDVAAPLIKEKNTDHLYNYYRSNLFIANNTPLQKLIDVMNEAYGSQVATNDPALAAEPINTTIKVDDGLNNNLNVLCQTLDLKMERNENKILLSRNK